MNHERQAAQANLLPHYTKGGAWHDADFPVIDTGNGCYVTDTDGNEYLDGLAGLFCTNIGHGRQDRAATPTIAGALRAQPRRTTQQRRRLWTPIP